ncbi:hypothetical protein EOD39_2115 [Acipenser ruthenus]|uniref:Uncharacterized protein n=1 Tax=Acipenser ruthenus TaxID=7906 RepID=A0A444U435_ACIRT|nr:hypothetical protein EOD39_2115 [Acipenser ruthenus]
MASTTMFSPYQHGVRLALNTSSIIAITTKSFELINPKLCTSTALNPICVAITFGDDRTGGFGGSLRDAFPLPALEACASPHARAAPDQSGNPFLSLLSVLSCWTIPIAPGGVSAKQSPFICFQILRNVTFDQALPLQ